MKQRLACIGRTPSTDSFWSLNNKIGIFDILFTNDKNVNTFLAIQLFWTITNMFDSQNFSSLQ